MDLLKKILFTNQYVFLSTSSASGIWEASHPQLRQARREGAGHLLRGLQRQVGRGRGRLRPPGRCPEGRLGQGRHGRR